MLSLSVGNQRRRSDDDVGVQEHPLSHHTDDHAAPDEEHSLRPQLRPTGRTRTHHAAHWQSKVRSCFYQFCQESILFFDSSSG